jgi:hypothetical protein
MQQKPKLYEAAISKLPLREVYEQFLDSDSQIKFGHLVERIIEEVEIKMDDIYSLHINKILEQHEAMIRKHEGALREVAQALCDQDMMIKMLAGAQEAMDELQREMDEAGRCE